MTNSDQKEIIGLSKELKILINFLIRVAPLKEGTILSEDNKNRKLRNHMIPHRDLLYSPIRREVWQILIEESCEIWTSIGEALASYQYRVAVPFMQSTNIISWDKR